MATVARKRRNITVSLPKEEAEAIDAWAAEAGKTRSAVFVELMLAERQRRREAQLEQDVRDAVADGFYDDIEFYLPAQAEVALAEPA